jgi:HTH-type transcriptional regulator/antitoxin HigA
MVNRLIKTESDYEQALSRIEELMDAETGTPEADELELMATLVEMYEDTHYWIDYPDPIDAIRFRMEQGGLKQADLVPYIGSASRVSEILKGKRTLSLSMIRKLHEGLGIPAEVLLQNPGAAIPTAHPEIDWLRFPIGQMLKRGWFGGFHGTVAEAKEKAEELVAPLIFPDGVEAGSIPCFLRRSVRADAEMDSYALSAWCARILAKAREESLPEYKSGTVTKSFCRELVHLSFLGEGPALAVEFLHQSGIHLVTERHLPKTHLDGASFWSSSERPVIALTLRYDRLDNFWFTLCHELAHVSLHLEKDHGDAFIDDLTAHGAGNPETKADEFAAECLIPSSRWDSSGLDSGWSSTAVAAFASDLRIHPAIVAGRIRRE